MSVLVSQPIDRVKFLEYFNSLLYHANSNTNNFICIELNKSILIAIKFDWLRCFSKTKMNRLFVEPESYISYDWGNDEFYIPKVDVREYGNEIILSCTGEHNIAQKGWRIDVFKKDPKNHVTLDSVIKILNLIEKQREKITFEYVVF